MKYTIFYFLLLFSNIPADRFNIGWNKKASGKGKDLRDFFRPMTRLRVEAAKVNNIKTQKRIFVSTQCMNINMCRI